MTPTRLTFATGLALLCAAASAQAADLDACKIGSPEVIKRLTGLDLSIDKPSTPAGPGGSSACVLKGKQALQSVHVQIWRGSSAKYYYQPAMFKAQEYTGAGYKAFMAHSAKPVNGTPLYSGNGGVLKGEVYLSLMLDARSQAVSAEQVKALLDQLAGQL